MNKEQVGQEYIKLKYEISENRPKTNKPYPPDIVKRRILLLYAQVHLAEISWSKRCKDFVSESLHTEAYNLVMSQYYE